MKKTKVEPLQESLDLISENSLNTLKPKGMESDHNGYWHIREA